MITTKLATLFADAGLLCLAGIVGIGTVFGQFTQDKPTIHVDSSAYSPDIRNAFHTFKEKCAECHDLNKSLKATMSSAQWTTIVKQMEAMPSSHMSDTDATKVVEFLSYYGAHQNLVTAPAGKAEGAGDTAAISPLYAAQGCDSCHSINGKGGTVGPSLSGVGTRLSKDQLTKVIHGMGKAGSSMPALPPEITDAQINGLVDYLATLK